MQQENLDAARMPICVHKETHYKEPYVMLTSPARAQSFYPNTPPLSDTRFRAAATGPAPAFSQKRRPGFLDPLFRSMFPEPVQYAMKVDHDFSVGITDDGRHVIMLDPELTRGVKHLNVYA